MEAYERKVIFSQKFPDANPMAILAKAEEMCRADPEAGKEPPISFKELLKRFEESETYEPRPDAEEMSAVFISLAIGVCRDLEIDTEIIQKEHGIDVAMDLDYGWYGGEVKRLITAVLRFADDFSLTCSTSRPDCIRVSMTYYTHDRYVHGKKADFNL